MPDYNQDTMSEHTLPLIISTEDLADLLPDHSVMLVAVCSRQVFDSYHIPGSVLIEPAELVSGEKPAVGKIPGEQRLSALFSRIGLSSSMHVVAYDDEGGGWAGRLIWTLEMIGHHKASYLDGGLIAWMKAGLPVTDAPTARSPSDYSASIDHQQIVTLEEVRQQIGEADSIVWDARASEEYEGRKVTAQRNGHIPNAVNLDWLDLMDRENDLRLKPLADIAARLDSLGITKDKKVITHCQTHHRSGLSWLVGRALGLSIRAYDGSWSEWGNQADTPIETD